MPNTITHLCRFLPKLQVNELNMKLLVCYLFSSRNIDSTFFMTMSDIVGFSLTMVSKLAGWDMAVGSTSSSFSSSDEEEEEEEWLTCADEDEDGWHPADVDSSPSFDTRGTFAAVFGRLSDAAVIFAGKAPSPQPEHCRFAGILPTTMNL